MEEARASSHSPVSDSDIKRVRTEKAVLDSPMTQVLGVAILEFGVLLHRSVTCSRVGDMILTVNAVSSSDSR